MVKKKRNIKVIGGKKKRKPVTATESFDKFTEGLKECLKCKKFVKKNAAFCVCGADFSEQKKERTILKAKENGPVCEVSVKARRFAKAVGYPFYRIILTPSGNSVQFKLAKPKSYTSKEVAKWCEKVLDEGLKQYIFFAEGSYLYIGRNYCDITGEDYIKFKTGVLKWIKSYLDELEELEKCIK